MTANRRRTDTIPAMPTLCFGTASTARDRGRRTLGLWPCPSLSSGGISMAEGESLFPESPIAPASPQGLGRMMTGGGGQVARQGNDFYRTPAPVPQLGRGSWRERVGRQVGISVVARSLNIQ